MALPSRQTANLTPRLPWAGMSSAPTAESMRYDAGADERRRVVGSAGHPDRDPRPHPSLCRRRAASTSCSSASPTRRDDEAQQLGQVDLLKESCSPLPAAIPHRVSRERDSPQISIGSIEPRRCAKTVALKWFANHRYFANTRGLHFPGLVSSSSFRTMIARAFANDASSAWPLRIDRRMPLMPDPTDFAERHESQNRFTNQVPSKSRWTIGIGYAQRFARS